MVKPDAYLSFAQILDWARQVASGLAVAHAAGIIHRDLKPENLMVRRDGFVKILDFGLAKLLSGSPGSDHSESRPSFGSSVILGTVSYTSPELAMGLSAEARSDQFSLGCILYEMVTGRLAFRKSTAAQTLSAIVNGDPEPIGRLRLDCPLELASLIERCFAKEPDARYPSSSHLHGELERLHRLESGCASSLLIRRGSTGDAKREATTKRGSKPERWHRVDAEPGFGSIGNVKTRGPGCGRKRCYAASRHS